VGGGHFALWSFVLALLLFVRPAHAAAEDAHLREAVQQAMTEDYPANLGEAKRKVQEALDRCKGGRCSGSVRAEALVALGMIQSQLGDENGAKALFVGAVQVDPRARLPASGVTPNIRQQWADAQGTAASAPPPAPEPPSPAEEPPPAATAPATPALPAGWRSREAFDLAMAAVKALQANNFEECIEKNKDSLRREDKPRTRLVLARCQEKSGHYIDALKDAQQALMLGLKARDGELIHVARPRVEELIKKMPHVTFQVQPGTTVAEVKFDDRNVPLDALSKKFSIDPGKHHVSVNGLINGVPGAMEDDYEVRDGELVTVRIQLQATPGAITKGQLECLLKAKSDEEIQKCVEKSGKGLLVKAALDSSGYADSNHVYVFSPEIAGQVVSPTGGWNVGASYTLDVVTAASPDIVSEASHRFKERRNAVAVGGGYKPGLYGVQANASLSLEPDYVSRNIGLAVTGDFRDKLVTPRLGYRFGHDTIGRAGTPFDVYSKSLDIHEIDAGSTFVLSPTMVFVAGLTMQVERGDQSKPYRYVPMFDPAIAEKVPVGATVDLVNQFRLPIRPLEQLPTERDRFAIAGRIAKRIGNATLRIEERLYTDTWATKASTSDGTYLVDLSKHLRVWPHARLHAQTGTNFYNRAYAALTFPNLAVQVPTYRTGDRELAPMVTFTGGGGTRIGLGSPEAATQFAVVLTGDFMYTRYFNSLFVITRSAVYGTVGFEAEFE
jgi:Protein of unknown function (DUF3570)